jgi:hypothetical protein
MGRLTLADGSCISVSLPPRDIERLRQLGPRAMSIRGSVFPDPGFDAEITWIEVEGRAIGRGQCGGDFYIFVD